MKSWLVTPFALAPDDEPLRGEIETHLIAELLRRGRGAGLALLPVFAFMWEIVGDSRRPALCAAFGAALAIVVVRLAFLVWWCARGVGPKRWAFGVFAVLSTILGVGYGAIVMTAAAGNPLQDLTAALNVVAVCALGVVSLSPSPTVYAAYVLSGLGALFHRSLAHPVPGFETLAPVMIASLIVGLGVMIFFVHRSLFEQVLLSIKLREMALRDPLTGLRNRRAIQEAMIHESARLERTQASPRREPVLGPQCAMFVLVDIDHFKRINDAYGHEAGDAVLTQLAQLLLEATRRVDLVARWGGEEFLVVATDVNMAAPFPLPERIRRRVEEHVFLLPDGGTLRCTCSIGVAALSATRDGRVADWSHSVRDADSALYAAKGGGRNQVIYADEAAAA